MPAPIAVLRDIADRGLDPNKPHGRIGSDGRLAHRPAPHVEQEVVVREIQPHADLLPLAPPRVEEAQAPQVEVMPSVEVVDEKADSAAETEQASPAVKKGPRGKKHAVESQA